MPLTTLDDVLSIDTLTFLVKTFATQRDDHAVGKLFAKLGRPLKPKGETASWDEVRYHRHLAPVAGRDSPHPQVRRLGSQRRECVMASIKVYKDLLKCTAKLVDVRSASIHIFPA